MSCDFFSNPYVTIPSRKKTSAIVFKLPCRTHTRDASYRHTQLKTILARSHVAGSKNKRPQCTADTMCVSFAALHVISKLRPSDPLVSISRISDLSFARFYGLNLWFRKWSQTTDRISTQTDKLDMTFKCMEHYAPSGQQFHSKF